MTPSIRKLCWLIPLTAALVACGSPEQSASDSQADAAPAAAPVDINELIAVADVKRGQTLYFQCRACHTLNEGGANKVGPNLWGLLGKTAGVEPGFAYSDALKNSGIVWTPETLDGWFEQPATFLPGNIMVFVGVKKPQDRADLIAYLQQSTAAAE